MWHTVGKAIGAAFLLFSTLALVGCMAWRWRGQPQPFGVGQSFRSNGEQIYFTATSQRGTPITSDFRIGMMGAGTIACANCHGSDGRGGPVSMMMYNFDAPDIRCKTLTSDEMEDHPPYTDETIKRAITDGVDPAGHSLKSPMPHWTMSQADLDDLIAFLKTLR